ncbi:hypothetical protein [Thermococcus sp.]|uniref:hypothetical protein n=1 Tax=Thermococcus sp. TaxID=35749 RepID=UPI00261DF2AC|nr:hypothetical protein [Thermococcus sp.]
MNLLTVTAAIIFSGFAVRTVYLLLQEERKKDLLLTTALWGLALFVWGGYLWSLKGLSAPALAVVFLGIVTFALSLIGLFELREENPKEFGKEL